MLILWNTLSFKITVQSPERNNWPESRKGWNNPHDSHVIQVSWYKCGLCHPFSSVFLALLELFSSLQQTSPAMISFPSPWHVFVYLLLLDPGASALDKYIAAVYEHSVVLAKPTPKPVSSEEALKLMNKNMDVLEEAIKLAAKQVLFDKVTWFILWWRDHQHHFF